MEGFNLEKYMEYQKELFEKFQKSKISSKEYHDLSFYVKESEHIKEVMKPLVEYIREHNLPFTIGYAPMNVQYLYEANRKLIDKQMELANRFKSFIDKNT